VHELVALNAAIMSPAESDVHVGKHVSGKLAEVDPAELLKM